MRRLATLLAALLLAFPGAAFAQGAGDDQYQDPFGDEPADSGSGGGGGGSGSDGGLSDEPPVSGSGSSGSASSGSGASGSGSAPSTAAEAPTAPAQASGQLPNTGSEPILLMGLGVAFVLTGAGLRLRTIDPDDF